MALDTSSLVAYVRGAAGADVEMVATALDHRQAVLPPVVLTEITRDADFRHFARIAGLVLL